MGSGVWSTDVYDAAARMRSATGASAFAYSDSGARVVHPDLDPMHVTSRESRDSDDHPQSIAIAVLFDVTGSMRQVPRVLQQKLPGLLGLLLRKGYATDPQILFGAIGDATCDRAPLQVGQFESDNRMDDDLGRFVLEGGGGGQNTESYELAMYFMARHTSIDCYQKRGRRGYLFIIGDELAYPTVKRAEVERILGEDIGQDIGRDIGQDIPTEAIVAELRRRYDVYYILPSGAFNAGSAVVLDFWRDLLGQNVIELDDLDAVCETIALTIGLGEGTTDMAAGLDDLVDIGSSAAGTVSTALARVGADRGTVVVGARLPDLDDAGSAGVTRIVPGSGA
jgi:hypothetical protein